MYEYEKTEHHLFVRFSEIKPRHFFKEFTRVSEWMINYIKCMSFKYIIFHFMKQFLLNTTRLHYQFKKRKKSS